MWLVGMMGAGKSSVGPRLAQRLGRPFVDADGEIERAAGAAVAEIFVSEGEAGFRRREREMVARWAGRPAVVALGGGAIAQPGAAERLAATGTVVYLRARLETLLRRVGDGTGRPLLAADTPEERRSRLEKLLAERGPCYETAALAVDTDEADPETLAREIAQRLEAPA